MSHAVETKQHSELGASVAARWMACPGSVRLSRTVPVPATTSFAQEGTAAHALGELALRKNCDPDMWLGVTLEGVEVTEEMVEFVRMYVDHCREIAAKCSTTLIEHRFNLAALNPPGPMFGTADHTGYEPARRRLHVSDLKYGMGVVVEVKGNKQLRYYGLGAALSPEVAGLAIDDVEIHVVQPRARHADGIVRSEVIPLDELIGYAGELMEAARNTLRPGAELHAGSHCKFCPASGVCPEQLKRAESVAMVEFSALPPDLPPEPEVLPPALFAELLGKLPILEDWVKAMKMHATRTLEGGGAVPGFKLVMKRPTRKWVNDDEVADYLKADGRTHEEIYKLDLKSPAQIEKLVGKKNLPKELWKNESSGTSMVPESDPRDAVMVGHEFTAISAGESQEG